MTTNPLMVHREVAPVRLRVAENLRAAIESQHFRPGDRLREKELCELTGTSRTSVREALRQLESEGLVEVVPNVGPIVARVSPKAAREIYEVRSALEGLAGRLCAQRATDEQLARLTQVINDFSNSRVEVVRQLELKRHFYDVLLEAANNDEISKMLGGLRTRVTVLRTTTLSRPGRYAETVEELQRILSAITSRDADAAEAACKAHVNAALKTALEAMEDEALI